MGVRSYIIGLGAFLGHLAAAQNCAPEWGQCGGTGFTGPTCCQSGNVCVSLNPYYYQCTSATGVVSTTTTTTTSARTTTTSHSSTTTGSGGTSTTSPGASGPSSLSTPYLTSTSLNTGATATQVPYPSVASDSCGAWEEIDNVCCPYYCLSDDLSSDCGSCSGSCGFSDSSMCKSGTMWGETFALDDTATEWHYSRSTHFGLTSGGACGFGMYGLCTSSPENWVQTMLGSTCQAFCTAYPTLCQDPSSGPTLRGNFAAPNGDYYTQFWSALAAEGNPDNYLSCGECFELIQTKPDGTLYAVGEAGYTPSIYLEIVDSCPCSANPKWCCGSGADHCGEIDFTYGCPLPEDSHHMDLSDIAMGRLQGNGSLTNGVIPIQYRRVACPKVGNAYIWLRPGAGPYYLALTVVNTANMGSVVRVEARGSGDSDWVEFQHDPNYSSSRPQERYGAWVLPQGAGPLNLPVGIRVTAPNGDQIVNDAAITSFTAPSTAPDGFWYIDMGTNFS